MRSSMLGEMGGYAWRELRRRKWRTATTILGYFLAVSATVGLVAAMSSHRAEDRVLGGTGTHCAACAPADASPGAVRPLDYIDPGESLIALGNHAIPARPLPVELLSAVRKMPTVGDASAAILFRFRDPADGHMFSAAGIDPGGSKAVGTTCCKAKDVVRGQFLNAKGGREAMVEEAYAQARHLEVGQKVSVAGVQFPVVGIINSGMRAVKADVYLPFTEAEQAINSRLKGEPLEHRFNALLVEIMRSEAREDFPQQLTALDPSLVVSGYACNRPAVRVLGMNETAIRILVALGALGVILFAAKSQLTSVVERRGDIGVLKAIGWSGRQVATLLLAESVIQGLIGGLLGGLAVAIGLTIWEAALPGGGSAAVAGDMLRIGGILGAGVLLALLGGILAGTVPALLSVRINPAEAIRKP
ncbi:MAG: ABC transporter permease [Thermoguttaceae bacterium]